MQEKINSDKDSSETSNKSFKAAIFFFLFVELLIIVAYANFSSWGAYCGSEFQKVNIQRTTEKLQTLYPIFQDINVMIFLGIGYLLAFLRSNSWSAVGFNFLMGVLAIQLYVIFNGYWKHLLAGVPWILLIEFTLEHIIAAEFAAATVLISFGAILGKASAFQLILFTILEVFFYSLNEYILVNSLKIRDTGGSVLIHTFGAYFGLTVSMIITNIDKAKNNKNNTSSYNSNIFTTIGTIFLWMYWPSFNSSFLEGNAQQRAQITTLLALSGSLVSTFLLSGHFKNKKLQIEDILNATLAGGVMVGASVDLIQQPAWAIFIGFIAGIVATLGFEFLSGYLQQKIELFDTAGIHNLHGVPGFLGGIISSIFVGTIQKDGFFDDRSSAEQAKYQIIGTVVCLVVAIATGIVTGFAMKMPWLNPPTVFFVDVISWNIEKNQGYASEPQSGIASESDPSLIDSIKIGQKQIHQVPSMNDPNKAV